MDKTPETVNTLPSREAVMIENIHRDPGRYESNRGPGSNTSLTSREAEHQTLTSRIAGNRGVVLFLTIVILILIQYNRLTNF